MCLSVLVLRTSDTGAILGFMLQPGFPTTFNFVNTRGISFIILKRTVDICQPATSEPYPCARPAFHGPLLWTCGGCSWKPLPPFPRDLFTTAQKELMPPFSGIPLMSTRRQRRNLDHIDQRNSIRPLNDTHKVSLQDFAVIAYELLSQSIRLTSV